MDADSGTFLKNAYFLFYSHFYTLFIFIWLIRSFSKETRKLVERIDSLLFQYFSKQLIAVLSWNMERSLKLKMFSLIEFQIYDNLKFLILIPIVVIFDNFFSRKLNQI